MNPGFILGPSFIGAGFTSGDIIAKLMNNDYPGLPKIQMPVVDVRECATAHLEAIKKPEAANRRFVLVAKSVWFKEIGQILHNEFNPVGYKPTKSELPKWLASLGSIFMNELKQVLNEWNKIIILENTQSVQTLGIEYRPFEQTVKEMVLSMWETGAL